MNRDSVRQLCLSLPGTTEHVQWGDHLVFKVGGKSYVITSLGTKPRNRESEGHDLSFKASPEEFAELAERPGMMPAPYLARAKWIALDRLESIPGREVERLVKAAYETVKAALPKKLQAQLAAGAQLAAAGPARKKALPTRIAKRRS